MAISVKKVVDICAFKERSSQGARVRHNHIKIYKDRCKHIFLNVLEFKSVGLLSFMLFLFDFTIISIGLMLFFVQSEVLTFEDSWDIGEKGDIRKEQLIEKELGIDKSKSTEEKKGVKKA